MADRKISELTALTTPATGDLIPIVDVSEAAAADKNKSITVGELLRGAPDGTAAAPGVAFESDGGNGMFLGGTDILAFSTGGTQAVTIDASQQVGIGISSPAGLLHIASTSGLASSVISTTAGSDVELEFRNTSGGDATWSAGLDFSNSKSFNLAYAAAEGASLSTNSLLTVTTGGNFGINTTSPSTALSCYHATNNTVAIFQSGDSVAKATFIDPSGQAHVGASGDNLVFEVTSSATEAARIDSSGRLLVGTSTYAGNGRLVAAGNTGGSAGTLDITWTGSRPTAAGTDIGYIRWYVAENSSSNAHYASITASSDGASSGTGDIPGRLVFSTTADSASSPTERMRIDSSGVVKLTQAGANPRYGSLEASSDVFKLKAFGGVSSQTAAMAFWTGNDSPTEKARIDSSGRLLVGTTSATGTPLFTVSGAGSGSNTAVMSLAHKTAPIAGTQLGQLNFTGPASDSLSFARINAFADGTPSGTSTPGRLSVLTTPSGSTTPTERVRVTSAGFFKATNNNTFDSASGEYHEVNSSKQDASTLVVAHRGSNPYGLAIRYRNAAPDGSLYYFIDAGDTSATRFRVRSDGDVQNHDNAYGAISDQKLKQDIVDAGSQWDDLKNLRVRKFKFISDVEAYGDNAKTLIGLVAQEAETVSPGLVKDNPDLDDENNDLGTVTKTINYSVLYMKAIKALQEAQTRIETLEAKVAALEAN